jgi:hypothetical protein
MPIETAASGGFMELDEQGQEERRKATADFLRNVERLQQESDARRAVSGEPAVEVLVGVNPEQGRMAIFDLSKEGATDETEDPQREEP